MKTKQNDNCVKVENFENNVNAIERNIFESDHSYSNKEIKIIHEYFDNSNSNTKDNETFDEDWSLVEKSEIM